MHRTYLFTDIYRHLRKDLNSKKDLNSTGLCSLNKAFFFKSVDQAMYSKLKYNGWKMVNKHAGQYFFCSRILLYICLGYLRDNWSFRRCRYWTCGKQAFLCSLTLESADKRTRAASGVHLAKGGPLCGRMFCFSLWRSSPSQPSATWSLQRKRYIKFKIPSTPKVSPR